MSRLSEPRVAGSKLSRATVVQAAVDIADRDGIEALSMRRLAEALGAGTMSIYYHVPGKDELLTAMVDAVVDEMGRPGEGPWKGELRRAAIASHEVLLRHPWAPNLLMMGTGVSQARLRHMHATLACLRTAGFTPEQTDLAYHVIESHIVGFTLWLAGVRTGLRQLGPIENVFSFFDAEAFPYVAEHAQQHLRPRAPGEPGVFEFGLDLVLDGLERLRDEADAGER